MLEGVDAHGVAYAAKHVYVFGGYIGHSKPAKFGQVFDLEANKWKQTSECPVAVAI